MTNLPKSIEKPGAEKCSIAKAFGEGLREEMEKHEDFYFFSPDETTSNRLSEVYEASDRAWGRTIEPWDVHLAKDGRVIELLSENDFAGMSLENEEGQIDEDINEPDDFDEDSLPEIEE